MKGVAGAMKEEEEEEEGEIGRRSERRIEPATFQSDRDRETETEREFKTRAS